MQPTGDRRDDARRPASEPLPLPLRPAASGQVVMGPAFYVWDEDPRQARAWGVELAQAWLTSRARFAR